MAQAAQDTYGPQGFQSIEILTEAEYGSNLLTQEDQIAWAEMANLTSIPVLNDQNTDVWPYYELNWGIPTYVVLAPDMSVISVDEGISDPALFIE